MASLSADGDLQSWLGGCQEQRVTLWLYDIGARWREAALIAAVE